MGGGIVGGAIAGGMTGTADDAWLAKAAAGGG